MQVNMQVMRSRRSLYVALLLLNAAPLLAPARAAQEGGDRERELRRVLHLTNGQSIRVVSRWKDDRWEYRGKDAWRTLESGAVTSVALESDLLREFRALVEKTDARNAGRRVELARWCLDVGLLKEGLEELDGVLAYEPDRADALAVLKREGLMNVPSIAVPADGLDEAKQALYRFGASMPPAARELAVNELGKLPHDEGLRGEVLKELRSSIVTRRGFGALALRRIFPGEGVKPLLMHAVLDPSEEVRRQASVALRAVNDAGVIVPVVRVLENSKSAALRGNAAQALADMGYKAAVEPLISRLSTAMAQVTSTGRIPHSNIFIGRQMAYVQDFDVEVAQFQAVADPQINTLIEGGVLDAAVQGVQEIDVAVEVATIRTALGRLTGASPGRTSKDWLRWWDENGARWRAADLSKPTVPTGADGKG